MRFRKHVILVVGALICLSGCSGNTDKLSEGKNNVDKVIEVQVSNQESDAANLTQEPADDQGNIDYDLTVMGSDMVYATVYQLMINPEEYAGKTIKLEGTYYATYYEPTAKYYHYVIIQDATACCAQGLEFIWEDGSHVYPDEYPEDEADVTVTGIFETYTEEGDENLYCRLKDASLEIGK